MTPTARRQLCAALAFSLTWVGSELADALRPRIHRPGSGVLFLRATVFEFQEEAPASPSWPNGRTALSN